jgi:ribokinase
MNSIVVIGSINIDLITRMPTFPEIGETIIGDKFSMIPGGKGANQAVAMGKLGLNVKMIGMVGNDEFGKKALKNLQENNINITSIGLGVL